MFPFPMTDRFNLVIKCLLRFIFILRIKLLSQHCKPETQDHSRRTRCTPLQEIWNWSPIFYFGLLILDLWAAKRVLLIKIDGRFLHLWLATTFDLFSIGTYRKHVSKFVASQGVKPFHPFLISKTLFAAPKQKTSPVSAQVDPVPRRCSSVESFLTPLS